MIPTSGVQKLVKTDCEDLARLSEMLPSAFPETEAKVTEIATGDREEDFGINFLYHNNAPD